MMNIKTVLLFLTLSSGIISISCEKNKISDDKKDVQTSLKHLADSVYTIYEKTWDVDKAGVLIYINGPSGSYMTSSNITPEPTPKSRFRVASISKTFTAAAVMLLHQENELDIDDNISAYLPDIPAYDIPYRNQITIKQLLQHRAGVFDVTNNKMPKTIDAPYAGMRYDDYIRKQDDLHTFTFDELVGLNAKHQISTAAPDEGFYYSNTGYAILGKIVEEVTKSTFSEFITQKFIIPLGLTSTYSPWSGDDIEMKSPYIDSYLYVKGKDVEETSKDNMSFHVTEAQIVSSPEDITTWLRMLLTGKTAVNASNVAMMKELLPADEGHGLYGLGLAFDEGLGYGHNGAHVSYMSALRYNPENKITILISANFFVIDLADEDLESLFQLGYNIRDACHSAVRIYQKQQ